MLKSAERIQDEPAMTNLPEYLHSRLSRIKGASDLLSRLYFDNDSSRQSEHDVSGNSLVASLAEHLAALMDTAYDKLSQNQTGRGINLQEIIATVEEVILDTAADAKRQDLPEVSASMLVPLIAIQALCPEERERMTYDVVAAGLAPEYVLAAGQTIDICAKDPRFETQYYSYPLNRTLSIERSVLIEALDGNEDTLTEIISEFDADFDLREDPCPEYLMALYKNAKLQGKKDKSLLILERVFDGLEKHFKTTTQDSSVDALVEALSQARDLGKEGLAANLLESIRRDSVFEQTPGFLNLLAKLIKVGDVENIYRLLTPGKQYPELKRFTDEIHVVEDVNARKTEDLRLQLLDNGMPDSDKAFNGLLKTKDPMSAVYIIEGFNWTLHDSNFLSVEFEQLVANFESEELYCSDKLGLLSLLIDRGLSGYSRIFSEAADELQLDPVAEINYFAQIIDKARQFGIKDKNFVELLRCQNPIALLELASACYLTNLDPMGVNALGYALANNSYSAAKQSALDSLHSMFGQDLSLDIIDRILNATSNDTGAKGFGHELERAYAVLGLRKGGSLEIIDWLSRVDDIEYFTNLLIDFKADQGLTNDDIEALITNCEPNQGNIEEILETLRLVYEFVPGLAIKDLTKREIVSLRLIYKSRHEYGSQQELADALEVSYLTRQVEQAYKDKAEKFLGKRYIPDNTSPEFGLEAQDLTEVRDFIIGKGLPADITNIIIEGWLSYKPMQFTIDPRESKLIRSSDVQSSADDLRAHIFRELVALADLVATDGTSAAVDIHKLFGITHFANYPKGALGRQLNLWQSADDLDPVDVLVIQARADWNLAFKDVSTATTKQMAKLGIIEHDIYFFEANDISDIDRITKSVRSRELARGHKPNVKYVIPVGHGSPGGLILGTNGEGLSVSEINKARRGVANLRNNARLKDYKHELGRRYEVLFISCSIAGDSKDGKNYGSALSELLGQPVHGATKSHYGSFIIDEKSHAVGYNYSPSGPAEAGNSYANGERLADNKLYSSRST